MLHIPLQMSTGEQWKEFVKFIKYHDLFGLINLNKSNIETYFNFQQLSVK